MKRMKYLSRWLMVFITLVSLYCVSLFIEFDKESGSIKPNIPFDYRYESFFPKGDDDLAFFEEHRGEFESDNDFIAVGVTNKNGVFRKDFLTKLDRLTKDIEQLPFVEHVLSPTNVEFATIGWTGEVKRKKYINLAKDDFKKDSVKISRHSGLMNSLFSSEYPSVSMMVKTAPKMSKAKADSLIAGIEVIKKKYEFDELHFTGAIIAQTYYVKRMGEELVLFMSISIFLLVFFLWFTFRSWWGVIIPLVVVLLSILWTMAFMVLSGKDFDLLTILMPTIIFVVGMSDVIHILSKYLEELRNGKKKYPALKKAFKEVGIATFLTSFTTAVGFYTLLINTIEPMRDFGWFTGAGVFISYILAFTLFPSVLLNVKKPKIVTVNSRFSWDKALNQWFIFILKKRKWVYASSIGLLLICLGLGSLVKIENFILEDLNNDDPVKKDVLFFEEHFKGVRPFELSVEFLNTDSSIWTTSNLKTLNKIEDYLIHEYGVGTLQSPITAVKTINQALRGGDTRFYRFPKTDKQLESVIKVLEAAAENEVYRSLSSAFVGSNNRVRMAGKISDIGSISVREKDQAFYEFLEKEQIDNSLDVRITGTATLIDKNNLYLSENLVYGLGIAFIIVGIIIAIMYKSFYMMLVTWLVNLMPLLMIAAFMGATDIYLRISTSLIFTISFGIAVDDTIHFLSRFKYELNKGSRRIVALRRTYVSTGKAIIMTSIMLLAGFVTLIFSNFQSTYLIGLLVSLTLFFAVLLDMTILPLLLLKRRK